MKWSMDGQWLWQWRSVEGECSHPASTTNLPWKESHQFLCLEEFKMLACVTVAILFFMTWAVAWCLRLLAPSRPHLSKCLLQLSCSLGRHVHHNRTNYKEVKISFTMWNLNLTMFCRYFFLNFHVQLYLCWKHSVWRINTIHLNNLEG